MPFEIDMLAVGNASAIILRAWDDYNEKVVVIDGGNTNDGDAVVNHIRTWSKRRNYVDLLIKIGSSNGLLGISTDLNNGSSTLSRRAFCQICALHKSGTHSSPNPACVL